MNFVKSFVRETVNTARVISGFSPRRREMMANGAALIARAYMNDLLRAADFITAVTKNPSPEEVMKLIMPATAQATKHFEKMLNDLEQRENPVATAAGSEEEAERPETEEEAREEAEAEALRAQFDIKPKYKFGLKINPEVWNPRGAN